MKTTLLFLAFFLASACSLHAQNMYDYDYDAAGNRIRRRVVTMKTDGGSNGPKSESTVLDDGDMRLYPNPTQGTVAFESVDGRGIAGYRLSDASGKPIETGNGSGLSLRLDLSGRPAGIYLLEVVLDGERKHYKIIKQN